MPTLGYANLSLASLTNRAVLCSVRHLLGCFQCARQIHSGHFIIHTCKSGNWRRAVKCLPMVTQLLQCRARCGKRNDRTTPPHLPPALTARARDSLLTSISLLEKHGSMYLRETYISQGLRQLLVVIHLRSQLYIVFWMTSSRPMVISLVCHWILEIEKSCLLLKPNKL